MRITHYIKWVAIACKRKGVRLNLGHSHATFDQVERAVGWGARHVDHLFCAMSDRARLRLEQTLPGSATVVPTNCTCATCPGAIWVA